VSLGPGGRLRLDLHPDVAARLAARPDDGVRVWSAGGISVVVDADIVELGTGDAVTVVRSHPPLSRLDVC
jgi:hypothetical protein